MESYFKLLDEVLSRGTSKGDRTGTGTTSVFGAQFHHDLSTGFPILTTKKIHWKSVLGELLWFVSGNTNVEWLHQQGITIWDEWRRPYNLERETVVIQSRNPVPNAEYTGNFSTLGLNASVGTVDKKLSASWVRMMRRCYDPSHHRYSEYGATGATVHPRWHDVSLFIEDVKKLPHWEYKLDDWNSFELDKDYYGARQYGPTTSVWLSTEENNLYTKASKPVMVVDNSGESTVYVGMNYAARAVGLPISTLSRWLKGTPTILKGRNKKYIGWEFSDADVPSDGLLRLALIEDGDLGPVYSKQWRQWNGTIDQLQNVIDTIRTDPDSRRLIVSAWNPEDLGSMALPPCHMMFQFYVNNGELSCHMYQRSADLFLGVPFNIASYAALTHMVAHVCDLDVGTLTISFGDLHIYNNHLNQLAKQSIRKPYPLPTLRITKDTPNIDELTFEDFVLEDYQHHPAIKGEVAV